MSVMNETMKDGADVKLTLVTKMWSNNEGEVTHESLSSISSRRWKLTQPDATDRCVLVKSSRANGPMMLMHMPRRIHAHIHPARVDIRLVPDPGLHWLP